MPWTEITRAQYRRSGLRYASDMTDEEWALIARRMPSRRHLGRPRQARRKLGRKPRPTAAVIDSQSAPTTQAGGPRGYDAGKRIYGRKRHIVTDTNGLLLAVHVHPANVQDCHGAVPLLERARRRFPKLRHVFADRIYRGDQLQNALSYCGLWRIEIVQRPHGVKGFQLLPRRWVVERTFAWCGRCRRLAKDFEVSAATEAAWFSSPTSGF